MFNNIIFFIQYLQVPQKSVPLHCVFHSIRFKVNKRLEQGVAPFFMSLRFIILSLRTFNPFLRYYL